ncbi:hypothetical protein [Streptomyces griseorubiginosus]|uniref:hypothetical protein n=1 Tax=Streptomyces griseorubiginosus TaxID=67304 RepID=UPI003666ACC0
MAAEITLDDEVAAADLSTKCVRLVALDETWTSRLGDTPQLTLWERDSLARLGKEMAADLAAVHAGRDLVKRFVAALREEGMVAEVTQALKGVVEDSGLASMGEHVETALNYLEQNGGKEVSDLQRKVRLLFGECDTPDGDLAKQMLGSLLVIGGFLIIAVGSVALKRGSVGFGSAALVVGGGLFQQGLVTLS